MEELTFTYKEISGLGFLIKELTTDEVNEILKCYTLVPFVRRELIEKSRNQDCKLFLMLETDGEHRNWHFGYQYPDDLGIYPFIENKITYKELFGG